MRRALATMTACIRRFPPTWRASAAGASAVSKWCCCGCGSWPCTDFGVNWSLRVQRLLAPSHSRAARVATNASRTCCACGWQFPPLLPVAQRGRLCSPALANNASVWRRALRRRLGRREGVVLTPAHAICPSCRAASILHSHGASVSAWTVNGRQKRSYAAFIMVQLSCFPTSFER